MTSRLRTLRLAAGLSRMELAQRAGLERETVARVERGQGEPKLATLRALARALGVQVSTLLADGAGSD